MTGLDRDALLREIGKLTVNLHSLSYTIMDEECKAHGQRNDLREAFTKIEARQKALVDLFLMRYER